MQVRRLTRDDMLAARHIRTIAFLGTMEDDAEALEHIAQMSEESIAQDWGCFDDEGHLTSCIINNDYRVYYDGHIVKMGGIGGVATLPEYRYGGGVKSIFASLLRDARENGEVFSSLYPFSHEFYRKVGYEAALPIARYKFPTSLLRGYRHTGWTRRLEAGESVQSMDRLYRAFASQYNLMVVREDKHFRIGDPYKKNRFTMLLGDERGERAYLYYGRERDESGNVLCVDDLAYQDEDGFRMILGYLARMTADFASVRMSLPADVPLYAMVPRPYELERREQYGVMARVTNVPEALRLMARPQGISFVVQVTDDFLPENSGVYQVRDEGVCRTDTAPDLIVSEQALAPMLLGTLPLGEAVYRADVQVTGNVDALTAAFIRKPAFLSDHF